MADVTMVDENTCGVDETNAPDPVQKTLKRKSACCSSEDLLTYEGRDNQLKELYAELQALFAYYKELSDGLVLDVNWPEGGGGASLNMVVACLIEESSKPLTKLVDEVLQKLTSKYSQTVAITRAAIKSHVLTIGHRSFYGVASSEADMLEDDTESCLWCWETRDLKLMPKSIRGTLKIRRIGRKKIHHRIIAISEMIAVVQRFDISQSWKHDLSRVSEKLIKMLDEEDIRLLIQSIVQKNAANLADKEVRKEEKYMTKQLEKNKLEAERERKRLDREHKKEKMQNEREQKRLQVEAENDEKKREKEEHEMRKQLKKQQEETEKDQRKREKEEAELKKQLAMQKQAFLMERFLKKNRNSQHYPNGESSERILTNCDTNGTVDTSDSVTKSMDYAFSVTNEFSIDAIKNSHVSSWRSLGGGGLKKVCHWGMRHMPKTDPFKKIKLSGAKELYRDDELRLDRLVDSWKLHHSDERSSYACEAITLLSQRHCCKQLLQFDKSHRPAFYGKCPPKSQIIGPRHPLRKDPELDYDVDSDEEWEEEDPGESLSDCDKDDDDEDLDGQSKSDENEDGSEDGFFVPDGYLSENEGVDVDRIDSISKAGDRSLLVSEQEFDRNQLRVFLQQQKYLLDLTEHALRKNQPFIILNLKHEKSQLKVSDEVGRNKNVEYMCLHALCMVAFPGGSMLVQPGVHEMDGDRQEISFSNNRDSTVSGGNNTIDLLDSDLPKIVSVIQSCSHGINKVLESLQQAFPSIPKIHLRNKVREISNFVDNHWQVKKDILDKLGVSPSPERVARNKTIISFFSKRCLPPSARCLNTPENIAESSEKAPNLSESSVPVHKS